MDTHEVTMPRTLIADDQPDVLEALRLLLKGEGYRSEAVTSPAAVLEALKKSDYDLLLMDLNYARDTTSGQEGLDLLSRVRAIDPTLPVVVMTAWGSVDLAVEAMRRGVRDFVLKPWENKRLLDILSTQIKIGYTVRKKHRLKREIELLCGNIQVVSDAREVMQAVAECLQKTFQTDVTAIFCKAAGDHVFRLVARAGRSSSLLNGLKFEAGDRLLAFMDDCFDPRQKELTEDERKKIAKLESAMVAPLRLKGELIGFVSLSAKAGGEAYDADESSFISSVVEQTAAGISSLRSREQEREFADAKAIQQGLLPKQIPQIAGFKIAGAWQPAHIVSGDYFDVLKFDDDRVALCIADVSGKGMPAALLMSNLQATVKAFASAQVAPAELCAKVNRVICSNTGDDKFITLFYCLIDARSKKLSYVNAGHNPAIVVARDGTTRRLDQGGAVLGPFPGWNYEQGEVVLSSGDKVLLFTDGITEVNDSDGEEFGEERLIELLVENRHLDARDLQATIMSAVAEYCGGSFQDDATLIALSAD